MSFSQYDQKALEIMPQSYDQCELPKTRIDKIVFYCAIRVGAKFKGLPYFEHAELELIKETAPEKLVIEELTPEQKSALMKNIKICSHRILHSWVVQMLPNTVLNY